MSESAKSRGDERGWLSALPGLPAASASTEREDRPDPREHPTKLPEERLYDLVVENGGRIEQSELVKATAWSPSKVSRKLDNLEDAKWIRRVRQGRRNVVFVPAVD